MSSTILDQIIASKHNEVAERKRRLPLAELKAFCDEVEPAQDFYAALSKQPGPNIIAECKQRSPSKGVIKADYDPVVQALAYEAGGAVAVSVLTDSEYFGGDLNHLQAVAQSISLPVLRKDFIIDEYQIFEARRYGASSYLLLAGVLDTAMLQYFTEIGRDLGMEPLVEAHNIDEINIALGSDAKIIGINNRDLRTMSVDFSTAIENGKYILARDKERVLVCESGVHSVEQIESALASGMTAFLIGEYLMRAQDPEKALLALGKAKCYEQVRS